MLLILATGMRTTLIFPFLAVICLCVDVPSPENVALGKMTWQSEPLDSERGDLWFEPDFAVDGNFFVSDTSCSNTTHVPEGFWTVDLGGDFQVHFIEILVASSLPSLNVELRDSNGKIVARCGGIGPLNSSQSLDVPCSGIAQHVTLFHPDAVHGALALCEVSVWGDDLPTNALVRDYVLRTYQEGNQLRGRGDPNGAIRKLRECARHTRNRAASADPFFREQGGACNNDIGTTYLAMGRADLAIPYFHLAVQLTRGHPVTITNLAQSARKMCDWKLWPLITRLIGETVKEFSRQGKALMLPYLCETFELEAGQVLDMVSWLSVDCALLVQDWADNHPLDLTPLRATLHPPPPHARTSGVVRVGFFSMTGLNSAGLSIGRFLQSVLAFHGKSHLLEAYCYGNVRNNDGSAIYQRLASGCNMIDTGPLSFQDVVTKIRGQELNVMVDLTGFTHQPSFETRGQDGTFFQSVIHKLMALGVAPLHFSWWGYTGTLGAEYVHYVVTDRCTSPPESRSVYAEKFMYIPDSTYLVSDHAISRREVLLQNMDPVHAVTPPPGLPEATMAFDPKRHKMPSKPSVLGIAQDVGPVLCSFNQFYKLNPTIWGVWMRVLVRVPGSVLWQLEFDGDPVNNLVHQARLLGVESHRIIVTELLPKSAEFLAKGLCDLYLDTPLFNAHTTAKDALWSGVPIVTLPGEGMASRVAASLVLLIDPAAHTVARDLDDYEEIAVRVARSPSTLRRLKERIRAQRAHSTLFDTLGWMPRWERQVKNSVDMVIAGYAPPRHMHLFGGSTRDGEDGRKLQG